jgi:signal transduction histidine kinase
MKRNLAVIIAATLMILAGVIGGMSLLLRGKVRQQLLAREAAIIHAVALHEAAMSGDQPLIEMVLNMVDMKGVIGIRFFGPEGELLGTLPDSLVGVDISDRVAEISGPQVTLQSSVLLDTVYADPFRVLSPEPVPLLVIMVPITGMEGELLLGYAEFLLDGAPTLAALHALDRNLFMQATSVFLVGGVLCVLILLVSFRQLARKNRDLAAANRELRLQAKTAAIGAISSHLFHGLKNTLSGLELAINGSDSVDSGARRSTDQLKKMVQEIMDVIQEDEVGISYPLDSREILLLAEQKVQAHALEAGVRLQVDSDGDCSFPNREGHLVLLVLENLLHNAVEASPSGGMVECRFIGDSSGGGIFMVTDQGKGIPASRLDHLFDAGFSGKTGGSGLGLAISRQLARQFGGELELAFSDFRGTRFQLMAPPPKERKLALQAVMIEEKA